MAKLESGLKEEIVARFQNMSRDELLAEIANDVVCWIIVQVEKEGFCIWDGKEYPNLVWERRVEEKVASFLRDENSDDLVNAMELVLGEIVK